MLPFLNLDRRRTSRQWKAFRCACGLAESVIKEAGIKLEENKASKGAGGGGKLKIVPYTVHQLSFGVIKENNVPGLYDGPFSWENMFGLHLAGMVGHDFFKSYAVTSDFENMQIIL